MNCAITGASGYLGSVIAEYFLSKECAVTALCRNKPDNESMRFVRYDLGSEIGECAFDGVDFLIHCAYDFSLTKWQDIKEINIDGSIRLLRSAHNIGIKRGIYISSMSSFEGCKSLYGKAKLEVEKTALDLGYTVIRPGLIWGSNPSGTMGALQNSARRLKLIPLIGDGSFPQYLVHEEDLAELCLKIALDASCFPRGLLNAAHPTPVTLKQILCAAARESGNEPIFIPCPWRLMYVGMRIAEMLSLPLPFRSDSIVSIVYQNSTPEFLSLQSSEFALRDFSKTI